MNALGPRRFRNILVAGLPGVGKTAFARAYAQMSRTEYVDLDRYVEKLAGKSIPDIFAQQGEQAFRELEAECLERLSRRQRCTIALGGGTLTHPQSMKLAQELGCIVLLNAPVEVIARRVFAERHSRPLLADCQSESDVKDRLTQLWQERDSTYLQADLILETSHSSIDTLKIELAWLELQLLREHRDWSETEEEAPLARSIPLADRDYRSPREQKSGREISDKMERLLKAQRQKDRGEKRSKRDKREQSAGHSELVPRASSRPQVATAEVSENGIEMKGQAQKAQRQNAPKPRTEGPKPRAEGPKPRAEGPKPRAEGPMPRAEGPKPRADRADPRTEGSTPRNGGPTPRTEGPTPRTEGPTPRGEGPKPRTSASVAGAAVPEVRESAPMRKASSTAENKESENSKSPQTQQSPKDVD
jgi:shikimate kinase